MQLFNTTASGLINHFLGSGTFSKPTGIAFALTTVPPTNVSFTELPNANGYARVNYGQNSTAFTASNSLWSFPIEASGLAYNNNPIVFPTATAEIGWASGLVMVDSAAYGGGNVIAGTILTNPKDIGINDAYVIQPSSLQVRFW